MTVKAAFEAGGGYALLVHGGAGESSGARLDAQATGCQDAAAAAQQLLEAGASALDAVQLAVTMLEDDPRFNAGTGGALTSEGTLELDAAIMEGTGLAAGAVCGLPPFKNPIQIARAVLDDGRHVLYCAEGAAAFARAHGFVGIDPELMITSNARESLSRALAGQSSTAAAGTVGAVARDKHGRLAAATSTGGIMGKRPGRVGDSPLIGAGTYAEDSLGAASATGQGEGIIRVSLAARAVAALAQGAAPADACYDGLEYMKQRVAAVGGMILIAHDGRLGWARSTSSMAFATVRQGQRLVCGG